MSTTAPIRDPHVAANLEAEFERTGMTNDELARALKVPERQVRRWRKGETEPRYPHLVRIAEVFGREPHWFRVPHDDAGTATSEPAQAA